MSNTDLKVTKEGAFKVIQSAINNAVDVIRPTYGPAGNKVIISKVLFKGIIDDGVQIARELELPDANENAVWQQAKEVAIKTNDLVGDGTTGALIMLQAGLNEIGRKIKINGWKISAELKKGFEEMKKQLLKQARPIKTKEDLKKVALISFDNEEVAEIISDLYFKLGKEGIITLDKSPTMGTFAEFTEGVKLDRGYISQYMITNNERMETELEKVAILLTDYRLIDANDVIPIMEKLRLSGKTQLVIIADNVEQSALATLVINKLQGKFLTVAINIQTSDDKKVLMEDLALMTGAKVFSEAKGDNVQEATLEDLGSCERFICRRDESIIVGPKGKKKEIAEAILALRGALENEKSEARKASLSRRLGLFTGKLAVIKVGAPTEAEQKSLRYKVEDAVHAVKAAFKGGVVPGAGMALASVKTSSPILNEALKQPHRQLCENMGIEDDLMLAKDSVLNVVTGQVGNFMEVGVMDPVEVLIAGVGSAVSMISELVTSSGIIVETPKKPPIE